MCKWVKDKREKFNTCSQKTKTKMGKKTFFFSQYYEHVYELNHVCNWIKVSNKKAEDGFGVKIYKKA